MVLLFIFIYSGKMDVSLLYNSCINRIYPLLFRKNPELSRPEYPDVFERKAFGERRRRILQSVLEILTSPDFQWENRFHEVCFPELARYGKLSVCRMFWPGGCWQLDCRRRIFFAGFRPGKAQYPGTYESLRSNTDQLIGRLNGHGFRCKLSATG